MVETKRYKNFQRVLDPLVTILIWNRICDKLDNPKCNPTRFLLLQSNVFVTGYTFNFVKLQIVIPCTIASVCTSLCIFFNDFYPTYLTFTVSNRSKQNKIYIFLHDDSSRKLLTVGKYTHFVPCLQIFEQNKK